MSSDDEWRPGSDEDSEFENDILESLPKHLVLSQGRGTKQVHMPSPSPQPSTSTATYTTLQTVQGQLKSSNGENPQQEIEAPEQVELQLDSEPENIQHEIEAPGDLLPEEQENSVPHPEEIPKNEKRGRKRPKKEEDWQRNQRKMRKNHGESYTSSRGKNVPKVLFGPEDCQCPRKCSDKFPSQDTLKKFFDTFWELGDYSKQNALLRGLVHKSLPARVRPRDGSRHAKTTIYNYFIPDGSKEDKRVCKKFFLGVLKIGWSRLYGCLSKEEAFGITDNRGKAPASTKIDDTDVKRHIESIPCYQSHYTRKDNQNKKYLSSDLNIRKMYDLYVKMCSEENKEPVKMKYYYSVFSNKFNLHFKPPAKDTCKTCDELELKMKTENDEGKKEELKRTKEKHLILAETARDFLKELSANVKEQLALNQNESEPPPTDLYVCTFDLQKALPFPKLSTSVAYYKRNMYVYNFGIHCFNDSTAHMYTYDETEGGRGAEDITSCLVKHIKENAKEFESISMFSDSCGGQNRNIKICLSLLKLVNDPEITSKNIDLMYMVPGHSYLPNDTDFGMIERVSQKNHQLYVPNDWFEIIKSAKRKNPCFVVHEMRREEFLSTKELEESVDNRKKGTDGESVNWLNIRWIRLVKGEPFTVFFKHSLCKEEPFRQLNLKQYAPTKPRKNSKIKKGLHLESLFEVQQSPLYPNRRPVTQQKKDDMLSLFPYIPPIHHRYFRNLPVEVTTRRRNSQEADEEEVDEGNDEIFYL